MERGRVQRVGVRGSNVHRHVDCTPLPQHPQPHSSAPRTHTHLQPVSRTDKRWSSALFGASSVCSSKARASAWASALRVSEGGFLSRKAAMPS